MIDKASKEYLAPNDFFVGIKIVIVTYAIIWVIYELSFSVIHFWG